MQGAAGQGIVIERLRSCAGRYEHQSDGVSLHFAWGARYEISLDGRVLALDDEVFVIAAPNRRVRGVWRAREGGSGLAIAYPRGTASRLLASMPLRRHAIAAGWRLHDGEWWPAEHVRQHRQATRLLFESIARQLDEGLDDPRWFEEQSAYLLRRVLEGDLREIEGRAPQGPVRAAARRRLLARLARVADLIHSEYERRLTLAEFAAIANLSTFHLLRSFKQRYGVTPYEFLQRRRLAAGMRLLRSTSHSVRQVAKRVGFADRRAFVRLAMRQHGIRPGEPLGPQT